jgi:hypothetical protein
VFLTAKIVPTGGRVGGLGGWVFSANRKTEKKFIKCLIFNGLMFFGSLFGGFSVAEKPLIFNALQTSLKRLIFNAFTHLYGAKVQVMPTVTGQG